MTNREKSNCEKLKEEIKNTLDGIHECCKYLRNILNISNIRNVICCVALNILEHYNKNIFALTSLLITTSLPLFCTVLLGRIDTQLLPELLKNTSWKLWESFSVVNTLIYTLYVFYHGFRVGNYDKLEKKVFIPFLLSFVLIAFFLGFSLRTDGSRTVSMFVITLVSVAFVIMNWLLYKSFQEFVDDEKERKKSYKDSYLHYNEFLLPSDNNIKDKEKLKKIEAGIERKEKLAEIYRNSLHYSDLPIAITFGLLTVYSLLLPSNLEEKMDPLFSGVITFQMIFSNLVWTFIDDPLVEGNKTENN